MSEKKEKGWHIFHNDGAHAKEWTEIENSAKVLDSSHVQRLNELKSKFKSVDLVQERELKDIKAFSKSWGFGDGYLPPEKLNTIAEYPEEFTKTQFYTYSVEGVFKLEKTPANMAKIREHEQTIGAHIAEDRKSQWREGF
jgi:hypothetical protein